jgi:hypothetical protein
MTLEAKTKNILEDPKLVDKLIEWERLKVQASKFKKLDKELKANFKEIPQAVVGSFIIEGRSVQRPACHVKESNYWTVSIKRI